MVRTEVEAEDTDAGRSRLPRSLCPQLCPSHRSLGSECREARARAALQERTWGGVTAGVGSGQRASAARRGGRRGWRLLPTEGLLSEGPHG